MVELNEELSLLIGKAWDLRDQLSCEINNISSTASGLCRSCCVRGQSVGVSINKPSHDEEKEGLIGIRDSISDVGDMLSSLQTLRARQKRCSEAAMVSLEESRVRLMELVRQHCGGRALHLIRELEECLINVNKNPKANKTDHGHGCGRRRKLVPRSIFGKLMQILHRKILIPVVRWVRSTWMATRLALLCVSISAFSMGSRRLKPREDLSRYSIPDGPLEIFHGRG